MNFKRVEGIFDTLKHIALDVEPVSRARVAACVFHKKKIISFGYNQFKTHPFQVKYQRNEHSCYLHAENDAIRKALYRIGEEEMKNSYVFVCRVRFSAKDKVWQYGIAKPCDGCQKCIDEYKIKKVFYTLSNKSIENIEYGVM